MIRLKAGDKVRFLNDVGGGVIVKIVDARMALVAIEDGFEIPVLLTELIAVAEQTSSSRQEVAQQVLQQEIRNKAEKEAQETDAARKGSLRRFAKNPEAEGFYLAFMPHEQQWILTGLLDVVLINHTPFETLYNLTLADGGTYLNADFGQLPAYSKVVIESISREDINHWCKGIVQAILISESSRDFYMPLHAAFDIRPNRFFKEGSYVMTSVLGEKAILVNLQPLNALKADAFSQEMSKNNQVADETVRPVVKEKALIDNHRKGMGEAVVDLHIGELLDNIAGLSSHDMFKIQMDYFQKTLNSAILNEYDKVTYIHGVGNGVLKNAIVNALENFEGVNNRMASMSKFGVGAIEVLIREKS
ncbi:MAG: DUF2027 domain-containing protein [Bacteroidetes bacterium]|jgi:hypothetical protein|nr:DUF2027 domain-containing protein [Bacteroidota bacterium]